MSVGKPHKDFEVCATGIFFDGLGSECANISNNTIDMVHE